MTTFVTKSGVESFETGGPDGLIRIEANAPYSTDDQAVISVLEEAGRHAIEKQSAAPAVAKPPVVASHTERKKDGDV